jgi:hypothetical protein
MTYTCPVCGYNKLTDPPKHFNICPSCGTEFENDDYETSYAELRARWIAGGARWWSEYDLKPIFWSAREQLRRVDPEMADGDWDANNAVSEVGAVKVNGRRFGNFVELKHLGVRSAAPDVSSDQRQLHFQDA